MVDWRQFNRARKARSSAASRGVNPPLEGHAARAGHLKPVAARRHLARVARQGAVRLVLRHELFEVGEQGHWITSSARASTDRGIVKPSALAVLRLMTSSNLVGCSVGRSAGLAPLRIL